MTNNRATIDRSRRHHQAETHRETVYLPGQTIGHHGGGGAETTWAIVTQIPEYNDPNKDKFIVQKASVVDDEWVGDETDIDIERALGFEGHLDGDDDFAKDIRNWFPWPAVGAIVPIIEKWDAEQTTPALRWYMDIDMVFGGEEDISSIRQNPTYTTLEDKVRNITQAVWQ